MIAIDSRMYRSSGIGTYIRNIIPYIVEGLPNESFALIGNLQELADVAACYGKRVRLIRSSAPIYSLAEQCDLVRSLPVETKLFWSPHYNIPLFYRGKLLVTIHDVFHLAMPQFVEGLHKRLYARMMFAALKEKASEIICDSTFTEKELNRFTGVNRNKTSVIHIGVSKFWFAKKQDYPPHPRPYILYVGNVKPHKNLSRLIEAFALIMNSIPIDLVIVGKTEGFVTKDNHVEGQAQKLGDRVRFTGVINDYALRNYYSNALTLVLPSLYEGFGLPPLEAMACGCPVIVSNTASLPEVCGDAVLYCEPLDPTDIAEKILLLARDTELRNTLTQKGLERARNFTWQKCALETTRVIERIM
jgi:glycosyltransferase involved in cell wall biosynthesis